MTNPGKACRAGYKNLKTSYQVRIACSMGMESKGRVRASLSNRQLRRWQDRRLLHPQRGHAPRGHPLSYDNLH